MSACQSSLLVTAKGQKPAGLRQRRQQRVPDPSRPRAAQSRGQQRASLMLFLWQLLNINSFLPDYRANDTPSQSRAAPPRGKTLQVLVIFRLACSASRRRGVEAKRAAAGCAGLCCPASRSPAVQICWPGSGSSQSDQSGCREMGQISPCPAALQGTAPKDVGSPVPARWHHPVQRTR